MHQYGLIAVTTETLSKTRILDIALQAGVSTATVDRVLNKRPGVRQKTIDKVHNAARMLNKATIRPTIIPTIAADITLDAVISADAGFANDMLAKHLLDTGRESGITLRMSYPQGMNPTALADALTDCIERGTSGIIVQTLDHPLVRTVIDRAHALGIPVVTILTNLPGANIISYVGLDNRAAGRSAALLMGRLITAPAELALFVGGHLYRSHEEREMGFVSLLRHEFPGLTLLPVVQSLDDPQVIYKKLMELLKAHPNLKGILNVGGGNRGIERALMESGLDRNIVYICFNLTPLTRQMLISGLLDVVIHQDMEIIARHAVSNIIDRLTSRPMTGARVSAEIVMRENA